MPDFGTLKARIARELRRSDLTSDIADAVVDSVRLYRDKPFWWLETSEPVTFPSGEGDIALSSLSGTFVSPIALTLTDSGWTQELKQENLHNLLPYGTDYTDRPCSYAYDAETLLFRPYADKNYTGTLRYYQELAALSNDADSNGWTTHGFDLIRHKAKAMLMAGVLRWYELAQAEMQLAEAEARRLLAEGNSKRVGNMLNYSVC